MDSHEQLRSAKKALDDASFERAQAGAELAKCEADCEATTRSAELLMKELAETEKTRTAARRHHRLAKEVARCHEDRVAALASIVDQLQAICDAEAAAEAARRADDLGRPAAVVESLGADKSRKEKAAEAAGGKLRDARTAVSNAEAALADAKQSLEASRDLETEMARLAERVAHLELTRQRQQGFQQELDEAERQAAAQRDKVEAMRARLGIVRTDARGDSDDAMSDGSSTGVQPASDESTG